MSKPSMQPLTNTTPRQATIFLYMSTRQAGGFILPFLDPDRKWDFRLKWVLSISTSGHKFGLVYPGLGWVVWKDKKYLPSAMSFSVNYLGAEISQVGLNFSRPAAQILGQYYQFIRLGFSGYKDVQFNSISVAKYLHQQIGEMPEFQPYSEEVPNPIFVWLMKPDVQKTAKWTLFDLQEQTRPKGMDGTGLYNAGQHRADCRDESAVQARLQQGHGRPAAKRHPFRRRRTECVGIPYSHTHIHGKKYSFES